VPRSSANGGDLLVLYDFEGGTDTPVISISRWTAAGDWSAPVALTSGQAEAKVNTDSTADDTIAGREDRDLGDARAPARGPAHAPRVSVPDIEDLQ
jgi:hypothetical protein